LIKGEIWLALEGVARALGLLSTSSVARWGLRIPSRMGGGREPPIEQMLPTLGVARPQRTRRRSEAACPPQRRRGGDVDARSAALNPATSSRYARELCLLVFPPFFPVLFRVDVEYIDSRLSSSTRPCGARRHSMTPGFFSRRHCDSIRWYRTPSYSFLRFLLLPTPPTPLHSGAARPSPARGVHVVRTTSRLSVGTELRVRTARLPTTRKRKASHVDDAAEEVSEAICTDAP